MHGPIWVPTLHGIIKLGDSLSCADARRAFERQFSAHCQVDIKSFHSNKSVKNNIDGIVEYANEHDDTTTIVGMTSDWDQAWLNEYYGFLHRWSRGSLRIKLSINKRKLR